MSDQRPNIGPPRPGYRRDPDPEGRWDGYDEEEEISVQVVTEYNWPAILIAVATTPAVVAINVILWRIALW